jgi:hypothetical protein
MKGSTWCVRCRFHSVTAIHKNYQKKVFGYGETQTRISQPGEPATHSPGPIDLGADELGALPLDYIPLR